MAKRLSAFSLKTWLFFIFAVSVAVSVIIIFAVNLTLDRVKTSLVETAELPPGGEGGSEGYNMRIDKEGNIEYTTEIIKNDGLYDFLGIVTNILPVIITVINILTAALLFYQFKLKKPIRALRDGINHIEKQDLDFSINYRSEDELGALCFAFDTMREKLSDTFLSLWSEQEKRTLMTRALAHDLRTPLAILKGHNDLLAMSLRDNEINAERFADANRAMGESIKRMERYLDNVREMQSLDDWELQIREVPLDDVMKNINAMNVLRGEIAFEADGGGGESVKIDLPLVMRAVENLVCNAMEYAKNTVKVNVRAMDNMLQARVTDDGAGFSADALRQAAEPFYRGDTARSGGHMGLGLSIAKTLAEKHNGGIEWGNNTSGAYVKIFFKNL